jgi:outer membrane protein
MTRKATILRIFAAAALLSSTPFQSATTAETADIPGNTPSNPASSAPPPLASPDLDRIFLEATGGGGPLLLGIGDLTRMALENNPDIKIQRIEPELGESEIRRAWGAFDPDLTFQTNYNNNDTPQNAQEFIATGGETTIAQVALVDQLVALQRDLDELLAEIQGTEPGGVDDPDLPDFTDPRNFSSESVSMQWGVQGLTPLGTTYSLSLSQSSERNDLNNQLPPSLYYPEVTTFTGLTITQPLLKGFGPAANMAGVRIARTQRKIGWHAWQQQLIRTLSDALNRYFDLVFSHENLRVRLEAVETARMLETQNIRRVREGKMRPSDVWEAQSSLANNIDTTLRAINNYVEAQNALKNLIVTDAMAVDGTVGSIVPQSAMETPRITINRDAFLKEALGSRPEYRQILLRAEQEGYRVRYARNQAYPTVNVQASAGFTGLDGKYGDSFGNAFEGQGTAYSVGVVVSIPLGNVEGRANLRSAKLRESQTRIAASKAVTEIAIELDTAISLMETRRLQVQAARETAISTRKTAEAEERLLDEGKTTTFEVVRLQNNASSARSRELAAIAEYRKAIVRLAVARGCLLEELGISLEKEAAASSFRGARRIGELPFQN